MKINAEAYEAFALVLSAAKKWGIPSRMRQAIVTEAVHQYCDNNSIQLCIANKVIGSLLSIEE